MAGMGPIPNQARLNRIAAGLPFQHGAGRGTNLGSNVLGVTITVQGIVTTIEHFLAYSAMLNVGSRGIVDITGQMLGGLAKEIHRPHIDTQATFNSIGPSDKGPVYPHGFGGWAVDIGPTTQQARFLEWGFVHNKSGKFIRYPFMIPASDIIAPIFRDAMIQLVQVAGSRRAFTNPIAAESGSLDSFRNSLYSFSKAAGDLRILGFSGFGPSRTAALSTAKILGDVEGVMRGALTTRVFHRVAGRWASGGLTASHSATVRGPSTGFAASGNRVLNRVSGFTIGRGFGGV